MLSLVLEQFEDRLVQILLVVAAISGVFSYMELLETTSTTTFPPSNSISTTMKAFLEPIIILTILILNATVGVVLSKSAASSLTALKSLQSTLCTVIRSGTTLDSHTAETLVPGDLIVLRVGDKVPADCRIVSISTSVLMSDEGSLTGESATVEKMVSLDSSPLPFDAIIQDQSNMLFSGSMITQGACKAVVIGTGMGTEIGKIQKFILAAKETSDSKKTPLGVKLDEFGEQLTSIISAICLLVFVMNIPKFSDPAFNSKVDGAVYYAKNAVALGVAAIPEGLPAVITLCLSLGTRRMAKRNTIVRKLKSVETLGCTSVICTDKTGTLTMNSMAVVKLLLADTSSGLTVHEVDSNGYDVRGKVEGIPKGEGGLNSKRSAIASIMEVSTMCNDAKIVVDVDVENDVEGEFRRVGEPTEAALCVLTEKLGEELSNVNGKNVSKATLASHTTSLIQSKWNRVATLEFNRDRKSMSALCSSSSNSNNVRLFVKGAASNVIDRCTKVQLRNGRVVKMTPAMRRDLLAKTKVLAGSPLRCISLAVKEGGDLPGALRKFAQSGGSGKMPKILRDESSNFKNIESGLTFVGLAGIKDPARIEVGEAMLTCLRAGIRVIMITGDAMETAVAIAKEVNIFVEGDEVKAFEGKEFFDLPKADQLELVKTGNLVFCRTDPEAKQKLVAMLQQLGEVPAMTGDGVNDAPALQQADIGIAMGITGTEVAKEAADMVLADDNFATIVDAVEEGRCIYSSMQAFICFLISCNIGEILCILFAQILGFPDPLTAMHLLWVNLVTDGPPATALGFNPPDEDIMKKSPRKSSEPIMTKWLLTRYCVIGTYVAIATIGISVDYFLNDVGLSLSELRNWSSLDKLSTAGKAFTKSARMLPQTLSLTTLVALELFKALGAVSVDSSLFVIPSWKNRWLVAGVAIPAALHFGLVNGENFGLGSGLGEAFGVVKLSKRQWGKVLLYSAPMLLLDEGLKVIGRRRNSQEEKSRRKARQKSNNQ